MKDQDSATVQAAYRRTGKMTTATQHVWAHQLRVGDVLAIAFAHGPNDISVTLETVTSVAPHNQLRYKGVGLADGEYVSVVDFETTYAFPRSAGDSDGHGEMHYHNVDRYERYTIVAASTKLHANECQWRIKMDRAAFLASLAGIS
jgi:hypothetical protein